MFKRLFGITLAFGMAATAPLHLPKVVRNASM